MWNTDVRRRRRRDGFTLPELLLASALTAALMLSLGSAINAAFGSYRENERLAGVSQAARSVLYRITRDIRTAEAVSVQSTYVEIVPPPDGSGLTRIRYEFDGAARTLRYSRTVNGSTTTQTLLGDGEYQVVLFYPAALMGRDADGVWCTKNVTIRLELDSDRQRYPYTASAAPRRNQEF